MPDQGDALPSTPTGPAPVLTWRRWRRGGGTYASHPGAGAQLYSLNPVRTASGRATGRYELTDFHWRTGRVAPVPTAAAGRALAEAWFADGPADDGHARLRTAWGSWHEQVPAGYVGVYVLLPGTGAGAHHLVTQATYQAAQADPERRIPVADLLPGFAPGTTSKAVTVADPGA